MIDLYGLNDKGRRQDFPVADLGLEEAIGRLDGIWST